MRDDEERSRGEEIQEANKLYRSRLRVIIYLFVIYFLIKKKTPRCVALISQSEYQKSTKVEAMGNATLSHPSIQHVTCTRDINGCRGEILFWFSSILEKIEFFKLSKVLIESKKSETTIDGNERNVCHG